MQISEGLLGIYGKSAGVRSGKAGGRSSGTGKECIQEGILSEFLKQNRAEAKQVSIYEYDEEKHMRQEREASWEEGREVGREEGREEGIKKGKQELLERLIQKKLVKGKSISEIAEELEEEEEVIAEMIQKSVGARK